MGNLYKILTVLSILLSTLKLNSQTQYTVVQGGTHDGYYEPIGAYYGYQRYASIYTYAQISAAGGDYGDITHLSFYCAIGGSASVPTKIYLLQTSATTVSTATWATTIASATLVYNSTNAYSSTGVWVQFDITDFTYSADNLMIMVESNYGGSGTSNRPYFYSIFQGSNRYWAADGSAPTNSGYSTDYQAHLKLTIAAAGPTISTSGSLSAFSACSGSNSTEQSFSVSGTNLTNDIIITPPTGYEISETSGSGFTSSITLTESGGTVGSTTIYVRTTTSASDGDGGNITCTSTGATTKNVATGSASIGSAIIYVNDNSTTGDIYASAPFDGSGDGTISDPYNTIADALAAATCPSTTTIYVDAGTYTEENISITDGTDDIIIQGAGSSLTIFDGDNSDDWLTFETGGNTDAITIADMTVKEYGGSVSQHGGAVRHLGGTNIIFEDIIFESHTTSSASYHGAVAFIENAADVEFSKCIFRNNTTSGRASVIYNASTGTFEMYNCLVYNNDAGSYGDFWFDNGGGTATITNCTFTENLSQSSGLVANGEVFSIWDPVTTFNNCIFYNNSSGSDIEFSGTTVTLNNCMYDQIDASCTNNSPVAGSPTFASATNDDFRLRYGSTGLNVGNNTYVSGITTDLNGDTRTQNTTVDLGCYEWSCTSADGGTVLSSGTVCSNFTTTMTVYGYESQYFKWQTSDDNSAWSDISSSDVNSYTTPALTSTTYYRTAASCDNSLWAYSSSVTQTVNHVTYYVNDNSTSGDVYCSAVGNDANNGTTVSTPKLTLGAAIALATCGDTIKVDSGTYTEENITIADDSDEIYIVGAGSSLTIFDGDNTDDWLTISLGGNTSGLTFSDMTVKQYGGTVSQHGGAIRHLGGTDITFQDMIFESNDTYASTMWGAVAYIENAADVKFDRCIFRSNTSDSRGSVIYNASTGTFEMYNCLAYDNDAGSYGDFYFDDGGGTATITNCTFTENLSQSSGLGASGEVFSVWDPTTTFNNCIFYNNASTYDVAKNGATVTLNYCMTDAYYGTGLTNNNDVSGTPTFTDDASDDFTQSTSSSGVDAGDNTYVSSISYDLDGNTRISNTTVDLGCYEYTPVNWTGSVSTAWTTAGNWSTGVVPISTQSPIIPNVTNQPEITTTVTLAGLTVNSGADITITSNSLTVTGTYDLNGTMNIDNATVNADATFDATGGTIDFTNVNGKLILSSTVTSLGTLDALMGTVEYDGGIQTVFGDNYYNLEIDVSGTKTAGGAIDVDGNLSTAATAGCKLDMGAYALNIAGDLTVGATDGLDLSDGASLVTFDGSGDQNINHVGQSSTPILLDESFATTSLPTDWTRSSASYVEFVTGCTVGASSDNYARLEGVNDSWLATKSVDASLGLDLDISFYYRSGCLNSAESGDCATVQYWNGSSWNDLTGWPKCGAKSNTLFTQTLSGLSNSDFKLRFYINSGSGSDYDDWDFDEISIVQSGPNPILNDLTINNSGGNIILNDEISVNGTITFTSGDIDASSNNLVLSSNASVSGADDDSHVIGTIVKTIASDASHEFPLGNGSVLRKVDIDPNDATSRDWTVTYTDNVYSDVTTTGLLTYVSDTCYWDITPTSTPASTTVTLNWSSAIGINDADLSNIKLAHFNGTDWELISTTTSGVPLAGSVSGNVTSFSPFTIGTTGANPLPVNLILFSGYALNDYENKLEWTTMSEKNADFMQIEKSNDGLFFEPIGYVKLVGNSTTRIDYEFFDRNIEKNINYYRLKQFDFDGKYTYTKVISIDNRGSENKQILRITNLIGQKVDENYKGVVIVQFSDGTSEKRIQ